VQSSAEIADGNAFDVNIIKTDNKIVSQFVSGRGILFATLPPTGCIGMDFSTEAGNDDF
jgi:hypothetical protein